ncbi:MAG: TetR/AcrR family transcriptional regulator [Bacteriovoracia bacterium]
MKTHAQGALTKSEKMIHVAQCTLSIIQVHGTEGVNHSRLARSAGVSRAWLYKYFGSSREALIEFAIDYFGKLFAEMEHERGLRGAREWVAETKQGLDRMLRDTARYPWLIPIYFRYKGTSSPMGRCIARLEKLYFEKHSRELMSVFKSDREKAYLLSQVLTSFRMGLAQAWQTGGFGTKNDPEQILEYVGQWMNAVVDARKL